MRTNPVVTPGGGPWSFQRRRWLAHPTYPCSPTVPAETFPTASTKEEGGMRERRRSSMGRLVTALAAFVVLVAACGDDETPAPAAPQTVVVTSIVEVPGETVTSIVEVPGETVVSIVTETITETITETVTSVVEVTATTVPDRRTDVRRRLRAHGHRWHTRARLRVGAPTSRDAVRARDRAGCVHDRG